MMTSYFIILALPIYTLKSHRAPVLPDKALSSHLSAEDSRFLQLHAGKKCGGCHERAFGIQGVATDGRGHRMECSHRWCRGEFFQEALRVCSFCVSARGGARPTNSVSY